LDPDFLHDDGIVGRMKDFQYRLTYAFSWFSVLDVLFSSVAICLIGAASNKG